MTTIREDDSGLFIVTGGYRFRPGENPEYSHAFRTDDGGLRAGMKVKAAHWAGSQVARIRLDDSSVLVWTMCNPR